MHHNTNIYKYLRNAISLHKFQNHFQNPFFMIRKQKSKILVFLLMLGILYGCKRHLLDPLNPQTQLPPKVQLGKVKGFYENGRYKNQPKRTSGNERMTAQDSARFKDFEPQWDKTEVELLPNNEKMLIVPVVRNLQIKYNPEIGFIRRLCIRVDENDDFLEANIVELVGNLTFVKNNYNNIFANYKSANITGFDGVILVYEIDYSISARKNFDNGVDVGCQNCLTAAVPLDCITISDDGVLIFDCDTPTSPEPSSGGGSGGTTVPSAPRPPRPSGPVYVHVTSSPHGQGTPQLPGWTFGSGSTQPHGGGGWNNPPPSNQPVTQPTIPPAPYPGMIYGDDGVWHFPPKDKGFSWGDEGIGDGTIIHNTVDELPPRFPQITGDVFMEIKNETKNITLPAVNLALKDTTLDANTRKAYTNMKSGLTQLITIMEKIEFDSHNVDLEVQTSATNTTGGTQYDFVNNRVVITLPLKPTVPTPPVTDQQWVDYDKAMTAYTALFAHELKHMEQFLDGKQSFSRTINGQGILNDAVDEVECYTLQFLIKGQDNIECATVFLINAMPVYTNLPTANKNTTNTPATALTNDLYIKP